MKLDAKVMTVASASVLFHRFFREVNTVDYDVYVSIDTPHVRICEGNMT